MPFINLKTNKKISAETADILKAQFGKAIGIIPGKSESWLMVALEPEIKMYFKGSDSDCAMISVEIFGGCSESVKENMTAEVTKIVGSLLGIAADRVYVKYAEVESWGWNGGNF